MQSSQKWAKSAPKSGSFTQSRPASFWYWHSLDLCIDFFGKSNQGVKACEIHVPQKSIVAEHDAQSYFMCLYQ